MPTVTIPQGILKGGKSKTENGFEYCEFIGVPYAMPPVGRLRFKSPQPPTSWENERDATRFDTNNISCQYDFTTGKTAGGDDCLYLNVYSPRLPDPQTQLLPVIVYIHGGGFIYGNGTIKTDTGPDYLIETNTVIVTINYRLGVLGFLSLDTPEVAGNMGLKDQVKALEWVQNNIREFGGDNNNVTIMGVSAGSASVEYLILSPSAKGLFHKAILQSGSSLNHWAINFKAVDLAHQLVKGLDYKGSMEDNNAIHEFLLTIPVEKLVKAAFQVTEKFTSDRIFFGFVPTVEKDFENGEAFLTSSPYKLLKEGTFNKVPVIKGFCNREGSLMSTMYFKAMKKFEESLDFVEVWPYEIDLNSKDNYNSKLSAAYLGNSSDGTVSELLEDFAGDLDFVSGVWIAGIFMSKQVPVHFYQFAYDGSINFFKKMFNLTKKGTMHGDDYTYVIRNHADIYKSVNDDDLIVRKRMVKMFTDFVKTGEPVPNTSDLIATNWPPYREDSPMYLIIDKQLSSLQNYEPEKIRLFEELYEKYYGC